MNLIYRRMAVFHPPLGKKHAFFGSSSCKIRQRDRVKVHSCRLMKELNSKLSPQDSNKNPDEID